VGEKRGRGEECISVGGESHWLRIHEGGLLCLVLSIVNVLPSPLSFLLLFHRNCLWSESIAELVREDHISGRVVPAAYPRRCSMYVCTQ